VNMHHDLDDALSLVRVDFAPRHRQPSAAMVIVATLASLIGSLLADAALVAVGTAIFPSTKGFVHFRFSDYAKLTVIGVVVACVAWPIVTRMSSAPRWIYLRLAVVVTVVLLVPDVWILVHGEPAKAVAILMAMHLAIAVVTYNCMVRIARIRDVRQAHV
jgi:FtsH-binding integral membrane protein